MTAGEHPATGALTECASEQLHLSGRIQAHGALIAADLHDRRITYVSANTLELTGTGPDQLFDSPAMSIFAPDEQQRLEQAIEQASYRPSSPDLYGMRLATCEGMVDAILHQVGGQIVFEIERAHAEDRASLAEVLDASKVIGDARSVPDVEADVASAVRALTGFDRAMVYRFHDDEHGEVVAEDRLPGLVRYLGHHFPADDIPPQARQIYTRMGSRYIPDVDESDVAVIASPRMAGTSLDLSQATLRSGSPLHLEYMRNMKTAASLSFAMVEEGRLTRLVSCTSESPRWLSPARRRSCELVVLQAKLQVSAAEQISRLSNKVKREAIRVRLRAAMKSAPAVAEGLMSASGDLLELCGADGAAICADGQYRSIGATPSEDAVRRLAGLNSAIRSQGQPWATSRLPQSSADPFSVAGCLFVAPGASDFVFWFRLDRPHELSWLGDPRTHSTGVINPRKSFDTWLQRVRGSSAPWTDDDLQAAQLLAYDIEDARLGQAQAKAKLLAVATNSAGIGMWEWDIVRDRLTWDDQMYALYGLEAADFTGAYEAWVAGLHPDDAAAAQVAIDLARSGEQEFDTNFRVVWPGGEVHWIRAKGTVTRDADGQAVSMLGLNWDITPEKSMEADLAHLGLHDALTGLPNRRHLRSLMASMLAGATQTHPVSAIFIDLNHFKEINDTYGHDAGDCVLLEAAGLIAEATRSRGDLLGRADVWDPPTGRLGGDEFVAVLPGTDAKGAARVAERIRQSLLRPIEISPDVQLNISAAIGVALAAEPEEPEHLLRRADAAMYEDKRRSRPASETK